jgi:hypothetical protein
MPTNVLLTSSLYTKLVLMNLGDQLKVAKNFSSQYSKQFGDKAQKIGTTFNVRKPQRFVGADLTASSLTYTPDAITDTSVAITVNQVAHVGFEFNSFDKTMSLNEAYDLTKPAAIAMASKINLRAAQFAAQNTFNFVGTPGTAPTTLATYMAAEDKLVQLGLPQGSELTAIVNRRMSSAFVGGSTALFNSSSIIAKQHETGQVVNQLGYNFEVDQTIYTQTTGAQGGTPILNAAGQTSTGGNNSNGSITTSGWTASTTVLKLGDKFTLANVFSIHPQTRVSTGDLQQFTVLADVTSNGSGVATITMYPAITPSSVDPQYCNVDSVPASNAALTIWGGTAGQYANKQSAQGLLFSKDAFAFLSVPMENPLSGGVEMASTETDPDTGLSISFVRAFDAVNRKHINRLDAIFGFGRLYPELSCVIAG